MRNLVHEVLHEVFEKVFSYVYNQSSDEKQNAPKNWITFYQQQKYNFTGLCTYYVPHCVPCKKVIIMVFSDWCWETESPSLNRHTIDRFKVVADKDKRKMSNIVENLIRRYVESRV